VVGELDHRAARRRGRRRVVGHARGQRPAGDGGVVDLERDVLAAGGAARPHHDGLAAATGRRIAAATGTHGDVGAALALVALACHHHVVVVAEVQAAAGPVVKWLATVIVPEMLPKPRFGLRTLKYW